MSDHKKYPADTPLTLQMLIDYHYRIGNTVAGRRWQEWVEPPKPQPRDGELWLVQDKEGYQSIRWYNSGQWHHFRRSGAYLSSSPLELTPIDLIQAAEDES